MLQIKLVENADIFPMLIGNANCYLSSFTEKYFDMKKVQCKEGLDIYKKFLTRMTRISEFLKVAEVRFSSVAVVVEDASLGDAV